MKNEMKPQGTESITKQQDIPGGSFSSWLRSTRASFINEKEAGVNCGDCKACCTSSYFIHIRPEETRTLSRINKKLLFVAPGLPKGNVLLGYDKNGFCPMMAENRCSIYEDRPQTCRSYDCRIFTAAGIAAGGDDKALINQRTRQWKFSYSTKLDHDRHLAVQAAARFLKEQVEFFPKGEVPSNPTQLAILAIKVYDVFLKYKYEPGKTGGEASYARIAKAVMKASAKFEERLNKHITGGIYNDNNYNSLY